MITIAACQHCGQRFEYERVIRPRLYCSDLCREGANPKEALPPFNPMEIYLDDLPDPFSQDELIVAILQECGERGNAHHAVTDCPFCGDGDLFIKIVGRRKTRTIDQMGCNKCSYQHSQARIHAPNQRNPAVLRLKARKLLEGSK